jgi:DNA-binding NtrC family response regulator
MDGTHEDVARQLGIARRTFYNKLQKYNLTFPSKKDR